MNNKYTRFLLERFFWWIESFLWLGYDILKIITFTLIINTNLINVVYDFGNWYNELMFQLEKRDEENV